MARLSATQQAARRAGLRVLNGREGQIRPGRQLQVCDLSFAYPGSVQPTIVGARLSARRGDLTCVRGRVETGKSTLAALLARTLEPTSGAVLIDGAAFASADLGWVGFPPAAAWNPSLAVSEYVAECFVDAGFDGHFLALRHAKDLLVEAGLGEVAKQSRATLRHLDRAKIAVLTELIDLPAWLILDDVESKLERYDVLDLFDFVVGACGPCNVGIVWLTSQSVHPYLHADKRYRLDDGALVVGM